MIIGLKKKRGSVCYQHKVNRVTKWYNYIVKNRQPKNAKGKDKKELQPIEFFLDKIKKPSKEG